MRHLPHRGSRGRTHAGRRAGTLIECVLVLSLLTTMSFGMIEFGYCYYCKNTLVGAAREGARVAILQGSTSADVQAAVATALAQTGWLSTDYAVGVVDVSGSPLTLGAVPAGQAIRVNVSIIWGQIGRGVSPLHLIGATRQITGTCVMRKEQ